MKKGNVFFFLLVLLFFISLNGLHAQSSAADPTMAVSKEFDMSEFPLWTRDLRRAEIVAFGSFPILFLYADNVPWPTGLKTQARALQISAGGAILVALVDYGIMRYKRARLEKETSKIPEGNQVIVRRPLFEPETDGSVEADEEDAIASTELSTAE